MAARSCRFTNEFCDVVAQLGREQCSTSLYARRNMDAGAGRMRSNGSCHGRTIVLHTGRYHGISCRFPREKPPPTPTTFTSSHHRTSEKLRQQLLMDTTEAAV
jgi:hypothetical protein